jgi:hypothetical protein
MQRLQFASIPIVEDCRFCGTDELNQPFVAGTLYFMGIAATSVGSALSYYNPYFSNLGLLEWGSICLHARIRGAIESTLVNKGSHSESCLTNCCCACCCYSCALAQESRELRRAMADHQQQEASIPLTQNSMMPNTQQPSYYSDA